MKHNPIFIDKNPRISEGASRVHRGDSQEFWHKKRFMLRFFLSRTQGLRFWSFIFLYLIFALGRVLAEVQLEDAFIDIYRSKVHYRDRFPLYLTFDGDSVFIEAKTTTDASIESILELYRRVFEEEGFDYKIVDKSRHRGRATFYGEVFGMQKKIRLSQWGAKKVAVHFYAEQEQDSKNRALRHLFSEFEGIEKELLKGKLVIRREHHYGGGRAQMFLMYQCLDEPFQAKRRVCNRLTSRGWKAIVGEQKKVGLEKSQQTYLKKEGWTVLVVSNQNKGKGSTMTIHLTQ